MKVSIFSAAELTVTDLSPYLPDDTSSLVVACTSSMRSAAFRYAYERGISFTELSQSGLFITTMQESVAGALHDLLAQSEHLVIFSNHFSKEAAFAIQYCKEQGIAITVFTLAPLEIDFK
ncbi:MAG: hypothetical protein R3Y06_00180 [Faecalibacterium sp.]